MKKIIFLTILLGNGLLVHCQQMFTNIPHRDYAKVYEVAEIGNYYYFLTSKSYYDSNNVFKGGAYIYKTDLNGSIVDSLVFTSSQWPGIITMGSDGHYLSFYTTRSSQHNGLGYAAKFSLGRMRYDGHFNFIDSFIVDIPQSAFLAGPIWYSKCIKDRVVFIINGRDTLLNAPFETQQDKVFMLDTTGNFLFDKALIDSLDYKFTDMTTTNEGENFIVRLSGKYRMYDDSLNEINSALELPNYTPGQNGLDKYSSDKFTMGFIKASPPFNVVDSFCVNLLDTSFNLLKQSCIPFDSLLVSLFPNFMNAFDTRWYDGTMKNSIYIGNNWGNSYYTLSNLDSNLNIRWSKVFGGNMPYRIERYTAVSDGGCFIMGIRWLGSNPGDPSEPVVFKISQQGVLTNITSFAPSAQQYFSVYPNPTHGITHVKNSSGKAYELMIINQEGKVISRIKNIKEAERIIDLSQQASGIYFYKIFTSDGKSASGKVMVK